MPHIKVDKKQAKLDAEQLFNGDIDTALEYDEPCIEEGKPDADDDRENAPFYLRLVIGGEFTLCIVPPIDGQTSWDIAEAIKRAGVTIWGLLQENEMLAASVGKDLVEQKMKLLVTLKKMHRHHARTRHHLIQALRTGNGQELTSSEERALEASPLLREVDALIAECDANEHFDEDHP